MSDSPQSSSKKEVAIVASLLALLVLTVIFNSKRLFNSPEQPASQSSEVSSLQADSSLQDAAEIAEELATTATASGADVDVDEASKIAQSEPRLQTVLSGKNVLEFDGGPVTDENGQLEAIKLIYQLVEEERGRPDWLILPTQELGLEASELDHYGPEIRSATQIEVLVKNGRVYSALPGFGTTYEEPQAGDWLLMADGSKFVFTKDNYRYHAEEGAIEILGLTSRD